jgi:hypothetical protein
MGLFALYRVLNGANQLQVFFSDIRRERSVEHLCTLPDFLFLIREITEQLTSMGFALEYDAKQHEAGELRFLATHAIPEGAGSSAEAIRAVCMRYAIEPGIITGSGRLLRLS